MDQRGVRHDQSPAAGAAGWRHQLGRYLERPHGRGRRGDLPGAQKLSSTRTCRRTPARAQTRIRQSSPSPARIISGSWQRVRSRASTKRCCPTSWRYGSRSGAITPSLPRSGVRRTLRSQEPAWCRLPLPTDLVDNNSTHGLLDALGLEAANFERCDAAAEGAETWSDRINWTSAAADSAFNAVEICGQMRNADQVHASVVEGIACRWRDKAAETVVLRHQLVEARRAELVS
jgi:hypothetical protein